MIKKAVGILSLCAVVASGATNYYFEAFCSDDVMYSSHYTEDVLPAAEMARRLIDFTPQPEEQAYRVSVTKAQYNDGGDAAWAAIPQSVKDAAKAEAWGVTAYRVQLWTTLTNAVKERTNLSPPFTEQYAASVKPWLANDMETQRRIKKANDTTSAAYKAAADKLDYDQAIFNSYRALLEFPDFDLTTEHAKQEASP